MEGSEQPERIWIHTTPETYQTTSGDTLTPPATDGSRQSSLETGTEGTLGRDSAASSDSTSNLTASGSENDNAQSHQSTDGQVPALTRAEAEESLDWATQQPTGSFARLLDAALDRQTNQINTNFAGLLNKSLTALEDNLKTMEIPLKPEYVGYFGPTPDEPFTHGVIQQDNVTIYADVFLFTERLRCLAAVHSDNEVKKVWPSCLRRQAFVWFRFHISPEDRELMYTASLNAICKKLESVFKPAPASLPSQMSI